MDACLIKLITLTLSVVAIFIAICSWLVSQRAFSLSLFNNRYKLYYKLRSSIYQMNDAIHGRLAGPIANFLTNNKAIIKELTSESAYLFGKEIAALLRNIEENIDPLHPTTNTELETLLNTLLGNNNSNLDSYFKDYLSHPSFKKKIV